jgi:iron complex transport system permease protein
VTAVLRVGELSVRVRPRAAVVVLALLVVLVAVAVATLVSGDYPGTVPDVLRSLAGDGPPGLQLIVTRFRLPRLLVAIGVGAALGIAGALFQSVTRNVLGSPDVIGFTTGSATGALVVIVVVGDAGVSTLAGSVAGGLLSAAAIYLLAYRQGVAGFRLVLVGIGGSALLGAVNSYLLSRASLGDAQRAQLWIVGTLNGRGWTQVAVIWIGLAVLGTLAVSLARPAAMVEMGDDAARARGVPVDGTRLAMIVVGILLTSAATATAGPIVFVALGAPQIAARLVRPSGPPLLTSAAVGAVLLCAADLGGQRLFGGVALPVGVMTAGIGGVYLAWLLAREWRRRA